jgi:hypothetical protein
LQCPVLERTDREIAQPQIGVAAFFPEPEHRPVQRLSQHIIAPLDADTDAFAEITALDEGTTAEGAAVAGIRAVDPECQRNRIAKNEIDFTPAQRKPKRFIIGKLTSCASVNRVFR